MTTITYVSNDPLSASYYKIYRVTDPFGRYAQFDYNANGQLSKITDVIGIQSEFTYGVTGSATYSDPDFLSTLKTPYHVNPTTFKTSHDGTTKYIEAKDPNNDIERNEFRHSVPGLNNPETYAPVAYLNSFLQHRNSFYWNKKAWAEAQGLAEAAKYAAADLNPNIS